MAATRVADIVEPEVFNPYVLNRTAELFALYMGPIISADPEFDANATLGSKLINMPFWNDITGNDEVLSDTSPLTVGKIDAGQDIAALIARGRALGANDLAKAFSGSDPMGAIGDMVADYKYRMLQNTLISILTGVFADNVANDSSDMVSDVASETIAGQGATTRFNADTFVDATTGLMGDAYDKITGVAMHSAVFAQLQKDQVIDYVYPSDAKIKIPTYLNKTVIVDDNCPSRAGTTDGMVYTSYLFGPGAIALGNGQAPVPTEVDRDSLQGDDILVHRWHTVLHPRGVAFQNAVVAGHTPTNTELENALNWSRVYERKNVRLGALITN